MHVAHAEPDKLESQMKKLIFLGCAVLIAAPAVAQTATPQSTRYGSPISANDAMRLVQRGLEQSAAREARMAIAIVEPSGELVAFVRMDGVPYASIRLAQQKARTSARLRLATATLEQRVQAGRTVLMSSDEVIAIGGGVPIIVDDRVIGAVGVSGGTADEDAALAEAIVAGRSADGPYPK